MAPLQLATKKTKREVILVNCLPQLKVVLNMKLAHALSRGFQFVRVAADVGNVRLPRSGLRSVRPTQLRTVLFLSVLVVLQWECYGASQSCSVRRFTHHAASRSGS